MITTSGFPTGLMGGKPKKKKKAVKIDNSNIKLDNKSIKFSNTAKPSSIPVKYSK